jgi:hypothetical protein
MISSEQLVLILPLFFAVYVVITLSLQAFFVFSNDAALKRRVWPVYIIGSSVLFLGLAAVVIHPFVICGLGPFAALFAFLALRRMRFCNACGATIWNRNMFMKSNFCANCGARLESDR